MPFIKANDATFYYELHGSGQPLVLISGYTCDHQVWLSVIEELSKHFQVLLFDNRGVGQTTDDNKSLSAELMAQDVISLIEQLDLKKPHIVGQSMGGTIAQCIAHTHPERIHKLGILTSSAKWRQAMLEGLKSTLSMREKNIDFDLIFEALIPWIFGESFLSNKETVAAFKKLMLENPYPQSLTDQARQFKVLEQFDGRAYLKNISAPTLIVHGTQDIITLLDESEFMAKQIPNASLIKVNCAHGMPIEVPQELSEILIAFLNAKI